MIPAAILVLAAAAAGPSPDLIEIRHWESDDGVARCAHAARTAVADDGAPRFDDPIAASTADLRAAFKQKSTVVVGASNGRGGGLDVVYDLPPAVAAETEFVEAILEAAAVWENIVDDPVVLRIGVDFTFDQPYIASTFVSVYEATYPEVRAALQADASTEEAALLDLLGQNIAFFGNGGNISTAGQAFDGVIVFPSLIKALDLQNFALPLDDAFVAFNTDFLYDFDPSDGITPGTVDTVGIMVHEIGHALGFVSFAGDGDSGFVATALDLFRFGVDGAVNDPESLDDWRSDLREVRFGVEAGLDTVGAIPGVPADGLNRPFSTGGDGRQPSHWKDNALLGIDGYIGIMDPTFNVAEGEQAAPGYVTEADRIAFSLMGWDIAIVPPPCPADLSGDGVVEVLDLGILIAAWGAPGGPADIDGNGEVNNQDLGALLTGWGPCD